MLTNTNHNPNSALNLDFDYENLKGKEFKRYLEYCEKIAPSHEDSFSQNQYFFELYRAIPIRKERYPGLPGTPIDFDGIELKKEAGGIMPPVHTTKIGFKQARDNNAQILNAHSIAGHGKYYLLKKNKEK